MKVTLKDGAPRSVGHVEINVSKNGNTLEIGATGVEPAPIVLEYYEGKLRLRAYEGEKVVFKADLSTTPTAKPDAVAETVKLPTAQETVNSVFPPPAAAPAAEFDEAAFDAA